MNWLVLDNAVEEFPAAIKAEIEGLSCIAKLPKMAARVKVSAGYWEGSEKRRRAHECPYEFRSQVGHDTWTEILWQVCAVKSCWDGISKLRVRC